METLYYPLTFILEYILQPSNSSNPIQLRHVVNFQKGFTGFVVYALMVYYNNYNPGCWLYLSLHGSYGFVWLLKDAAFPDKNFDKPINLFSFLSTALLLIVYWVPIHFITSGTGVQFPSGQRVLVCVGLNILGTGVMMAADAQKYFTLKYKQGLICDGMFKYSRSPNFLGEFMIYMSFAVCVGIIETYLIIFGVFAIVVFSFIVLKEKSNKKKKGWASYVDHSFVLFPKIIPSSSFLSVLAYFALAGGAFSLVNL